MDTFKSFETLLPSVNAQTFDEIALRLFRFQAKENQLYREFIEALKINPASITEVSQIPYLPIRFFKDHLIKTGHWQEALVFESSGTTGTQTSRHAVYNPDQYLKHAQEAFEKAYGSLKGYHLLALLPSYLERGNSSLVAMVDHFIKQTGSPYSGFYLHNYKSLVKDVAVLQQDDRKVIVWGVTYALLDIAEQFNPDWQKVMVFETGGMKGRRKEVTREELHSILKQKLHVDKVYSEYGMTELLSQAYTRGAGTFYPAQTMKILIRELTDPLQKGLIGETGAINVIDLANIYSIAFIETEDLGKIDRNGDFEVLGRADNSDVRGCNLLVE